MRRLRDGEWCPEDIADLRKWSAEGVHLREMASRFGRSHWAVSRKRSELKLPVISRSPYRKGVGQENYHRADRVDPEAAWARLLGGRTFA